jgi:hypothetical protein
MGMAVEKIWSEAETKKPWLQARWSHMEETQARRLCRAWGGGQRQFHLGSLTSCRDRTPIVFSLPVPGSLLCSLCWTPNWVEDPAFFSMTVPGVPYVGPHSPWAGTLLGRQDSQNWEKDACSYGCTLLLKYVVIRYNLLLKKIQETGRVERCVAQGEKGLTSDTLGLPESEQTPYTMFGCTVRKLGKAYWQLSHFCRGLIPRAMLQSEGQGW